MHRAWAAPPVAAPHRWFKLQEAEDLVYRDPLAEQPEVYAGHRVTSFRRDREEEPVLEPAASASLADKAENMVRLGRHRRACRAPLASAGVSELAAPGLQRSPIVSIRHMITAVRRITATRAIFDPRRRLIRRYQARTV